jgi:hypothetical protein
MKGKKRKKMYIQLDERIIKTLVDYELDNDLD